MPLSKKTINITVPTDATYDFEFDWVRASHISCEINGVAVNPAHVAVSGSSGEGVVTLSGSTLSGLEIGDSLVIKKTTPQTFDDRTVDFNYEGSLTLAGLDDAILHDISLIQDMLDRLDDAIVKTTAQSDNFDAQDLELRNMAIGTEAASAVTLAQMQAIETSSGALPSTSIAFNDYLLGVVAGAWGTVSPKTLKEILTLGTAAYKNTGVTLGTDIINKTGGDSLYAVQASNLSDLASAATSRTNLGLGTAAVEIAGTIANTLLKLDGSGNIPTGVGLASGTSFTGTSVYQKAGGTYDVAAIVNIVSDAVIQFSSLVAGSTAWTARVNRVPLTAVSTTQPTQQWNNTGPIEVAINTGDDNFSLTAGTWEIDASITIYDDSASAAAGKRIELALVEENDSGDVLLEKIISTAAVVRRYIPATYRLLAYRTLTGTKNLSFRVAVLNTATAATALAPFGQIRLRKLDG